MVAQALAAIALAFLATSGVAKIFDPVPTTGAMRAARLPAADWISRLLGVVETLAAVMALTVGGLATITSALLYASFTVFTLAANRRHIPVQSCGCFGREDTPPHPIHIAYNVVATVSLLFLSVLDIAPIDWPIDPLSQILYLGFVAMGAYASHLLLTGLPRLLAAAHGT